MFTENNSNITFVSDIQGKNTVENNDLVVLRIGNESVFIKDVNKLGSSSYSGTVFGFEPSFSTEIEGIKLNDKVDFEEKHIV